MVPRRRLAEHHHMAPRALLDLWTPNFPSVEECFREAHLDVSCLLKLLWALSTGDQTEWDRAYNTVLRSWWIKFLLVVAPEQRFQPVALPMGRVK